MDKRQPADKKNDKVDADRLRRDQLRRSMRHPYITGQGQNESDAEQEAPAEPDINQAKGTAGDACA